MSKDLWFAEYERILNELEDSGHPTEFAEEMATRSLREKLLDQADMLRKQAGPAVAALNLLGTKG